MSQPPASARLVLLVGPRAAVTSLALALRARGLAVAPSPLDLTDRRLGPRLVCPAPGVVDREHVCPRHDPVGYFGRAAAEARALEADQAPGTVVPHGVSGVLARALLHVEAHLAPLVDAGPADGYAAALLLAPRRRSRAALVRTNLLHAALARVGAPVVRLAPASVERRAAYAAHVLAERGLAPGAALDPRVAPAVDLVRGPASEVADQVRRALAARGVDAGAPLLLRTTEGANLDLVRLTGTDRGDRRRVTLDWRGGGYEGAPRRFHEVIFASGEDEVLGRVPAPDGTCLDKVDATPDALLLAYDARALEPVRRKEYAFRPGVEPTSALLGVFRLRRP